MPERSSDAAATGSLRSSTRRSGSLRSSAFLRSASSLRDSARRSVRSESQFVRLESTQRQPRQRQRQQQQQPEEEEEEEDDDDDDDDDDGEDEDEDEDEEEKVEEEQQGTSSDRVELKYLDIGSEADVHSCRLSTLSFVSPRSTEYCCVICIELLLRPIVLSCGHRMPHTALQPQTNPKLE